MDLRNPKKTSRMAAGLTPPCLAAVTLLASSNAEAHFQLLYPPPWITQDSAGDPQKPGPCGVDAQNPGTPTNELTSFAPGQKITLHFVEVIPHDGWYRISISYANRADLADPPYQTNPAGCLTNGTAGLLCNSVDAGIESPLVPPVVADGVNKHAGSGIVTPKDWTYDLTLPTQPCAKCTLQVEQIMLNHPVNVADGPFTYHHCADIAIVEGIEGGTTTNTVDGGTVIVPMDDGGNGSSGTGGTASGAGSSGVGSSGAASSGAGASSGVSTSGASDGGGSSGGGASGSSGGCAASGPGRTATAGVGLLLGALAAAFMRRKRTRT